MYFITCFSRYEPNTRIGVPDIGSARTVGYCHNKKDAIDTVLENCGDIYEATYTYAVVERIESGLYNLATDRWFFKWNTETNQYEAIEPFIDNSGNYAFG